MKKIALAAILTVTAGAAVAGGLADPIIEPAIVEEATSSSSGGLLVPLMLLLIVAAVSSN